MLCGNKHTDIAQTQRAIQSKLSGSATRTGTCAFPQACSLGLLMDSYKPERPGRALGASGSVPVRSEDWLWLCQLPCVFNFRAIRVTKLLENRRDTQQRHHFELTQAWEQKQFLEMEGKSSLSVSSVKSELLKKCWDETLDIISYLNNVLNNIHY